MRPAYGMCERAMWDPTESVTPPNPNHKDQDGMRGAVAEVGRSLNDSVLSPGHRADLPSSPSIRLFGRGGQRLSSRPSFGRRRRRARGVR